jgi:hypothetical protein
MFNAGQLLASHLKTETTGGDASMKVDTQKCTSTKPSGWDVKRLSRGVRPRLPHHEDDDGTAPVVGRASIQDHQYARGGRRITSRKASWSSIKSKLLGGSLAGFIESAREFFYSFRSEKMEKKQVPPICNR